MGFERIGATGDSLRIKNNEWYIGRNYAQNGDIKVFRVNTLDQIEFFSRPNVAGDPVALQSQITAIEAQITYILSIIGGITAGNVNILPVTLSPAQITAKAITLPQTPIVGTAMIIPENGVAQFVDIDFTVTGTLLSWNGLPFEQLAEAGDVIKVVYLF